MPSENPAPSSFETSRMGCPEATDTSENSSSFCLAGSSVLLNSALTQRLTSAWIACRPGKFHLTSGSFDGAVRRFSLREQLAKNIEAMNFGDQSWFSIASRTKKFYVAIRSQLV